MATVRYPDGMEQLLQGNIDLLTNNIKLVLIDTADYTYAATHADLADVPVAARVATSGNLAGKSVTDGAFDATDPTISSVTGDTVEAVIVYVDSGVEATSHLLLYIDEDSGSSPISFTPNGSDVDVTLPTGGFNIANN